MNTFTVLLEVLYLKAKQFPFSDETDSAYYR